jgi:hypothetical protein
MSTTVYFPPAMDASAIAAAINPETKPLDAPAPALQQNPTRPPIPHATIANSKFK